MSRQESESRFQVVNGAGWVIQTVQLWYSKQNEKMKSVSQLVFSALNPEVVF